MVIIHDENYFILVILNEYSVVLYTIDRRILMNQRKQV